MKDLLSKLVSINSVSGNEYPLGVFIQDFLKRLGFRIQTVKTSPTRINLIATFGKASSYLGFYGHMDTVPPHKEYKQNPFKMWTEQNGTIARGLGVCDMKGGIAAILKTAEVAAKRNFPVKLVFGVDEEDISQGAHDLIRSKYLDDINFLIVAETGQVKDFKQDVSICYGRKGRIVFEVVVHGKQVHAAESEKGINAISHAGKLISKLADIKFKKHPQLGITQVIPQQITAQTDSFSVPERCVFTFSALTTPYDSSSDIIKAIKQLSMKIGVNIDIHQQKRRTPYGDSYEIDRSNPILKSFEQTIFPSFKVKPIYTPSVADENVFANRLKIPVLTIGAIGGGDHTASEWVDISSLNKAFSMYVRILQRYHSS